MIEELLFIFPFIIANLIIFACFTIKMKKNNIKILPFFLNNCLSFLISSIIFAVIAIILKQTLYVYNYLLPILIIIITYLIFDKKMYKKMNIDSKDWKLFIILSKFSTLLLYLHCTYYFFSAKY